jgi:hypothetical protein
LFTSFGEVTKLLPAPYVFMISPRVVGKNDLAGVSDAVDIIFQML